MKNPVYRLLALAIALMMALSCVPALAEEAAQDPVLLTINGEEITQSAVLEMLNNLYNAGYANANDYELAIDYIIQDRVLEAKIAELGFDKFTAEEEEALRAEVSTVWEDAIASYVSYFLTDDTDEARAQARQDAIDYYTAYGYSDEYLYENMKLSASYDKLEQYLTEGKDVAVTEDEIRAEYDLTAAQQKEAVMDNVYMYELYQYYYGTEFFYIPEGYRGIIHILMSVDDALLAAYETAQAAYEDSITDEVPEGDAALKAARDAAYDAVIASKQAEIDDIYARLAKGEDFKTLIAQYGEDPGMEDAATLADGYHVHKDSVIYDPAFITAAFSDKMNQPGDVSDPVIGSYGIHILHYLRDIPGGTLEMSDAIRAEIEEALKTEKMNAVYAEALEAWIAEYNIVYNQEAIDALTAAAE